jgi:hypothetical protein
LQGRDDSGRLMSGGYMDRVRHYFSSRILPLSGSIILLLLFGCLILLGNGLYAFLIAPFFILAFLAAVGIHDVLQTKRAILRNYPISGHARYIMEELRPKIRQYFFEGEKDGRPFPNTMSMSRNTNGSRIPSRRRISRPMISAFASAGRIASSPMTPRCSTSRR